MNVNHPFEKICEEWLGKIEDALVYKNKVFGDIAYKLNTFFTLSNYLKQSTDGPHMKPTEPGIFSNASGTSFKMELNQLFEMVALIGPSLMGQVPQVRINSEECPVGSPEFMAEDPVMLQDEMFAQAYQMYVQSVQAKNNQVRSEAEVFQYYMNWVQRENSKLEQSQKVITQALVTGMGGTITEWHTPIGAPSGMPYSRYISQERVVWDQDARSFEDITWMAILEVEPINRVSEKFGIPIKDLRVGRTMSSNASRSLYEYQRQSTLGNAKKCHDLVMYWTIYSKNGVGQWMSKPNDSFDDEQLNRNLTLDQLGRVVKIVVCPGIKYPLNAPTDQIQNEDMELTIGRFQWDTPYWIDSMCLGGWPYSPHWFHAHSDCSWPLAIGRGVLAEIEFANYLMGRLAGRINASCDVVFAVRADLSKDIEKQLNDQGSSLYKLLKISAEGDQSLNDLIQFINGSIQVGNDVWKLLQDIIGRINRGLGTTELLYGQSQSAFRSAEESRAKQQNLSIRPDDMMAKTDTWLTQVAKKEALCAFMHLTVEDLIPLFGEEMAAVIEQRILAKDPYAFIREYNLSIEAGSTRRVSFQTQQSNLVEIGKYMMPFFTQLAQSGQPGPFNAWVSDFARTMSLNADKYLLPTPPPPDPNQPTPEQVKAQADAEMKISQHQLEMGLQQDQHELTMDHIDEEFSARLETQQALQRIAAKMKGRMNGNSNSAGTNSGQ